MSERYAFDASIIGSGAGERVPKRSQTSCQTISTQKRHEKHVKPAVLDKDLSAFTIIAELMQSSSLKSRQIEHENGIKRIQSGQSNRQMAAYTQGTPLIGGWMMRQSGIMANDMSNVREPSQTEPAQPLGRTGDRASQIHNGILAAILEHRLHPGTKLGEDEIGAIYGVSRTIVRAALQSLSHDGIVVIEKNRGAFVSSPTLAEAIEVFEARKLVEATIARRAAERSSPEGLARLNQHMDEEHAALARGDDHTAIRLSGEFHLEIARMADHRTFEGFLRELVARSSLILLLYRRKKAQVCGTGHHAQLTEAIARKDGARAAALMTEHLDDIEAGLDLAEETMSTAPLASILRS